MDANLQLERGLEKHQAGDLIGASQEYENIINQMPDHFDALHLLGVVASQQGMYEKAEEYIRKAIAINPSAVAFYINLGIALKNQKKYAESVEVYSKALSLDDKDPGIYYNLANLQMLMGDFESAENGFSNVIKLVPEYADAHSGLGKCCIKLFKFDIAVEAFSNAIKLDPNNSGHFLDLAIAYKELEDYENAIINAKIAIDKNNGVSEAYNVLASIYSLQKKYSEATEIVEKGLSLNSQDSDCLCTLGVIYLHQGKFEKSYQKLCESLESNAGNGDAWVAKLTLLRDWQRYDEWYECLLEGNQKAEYDKRDSYVMYINLLMYSWIKQDNTLLEKYLSQYPQYKKGTNYKSKDYAYPNYIGLLHDYKRSHNDAYCNDEKGKNKIYVVGESHSLYPTGLQVNVEGTQYTLDSFLIVGCQARFIADKELNRYSRSFHEIVKLIPDGSTVIMNLGEIDCRHDFGFFSYHKKKSLTLEEVMKPVIDNYVDNVLSEFNGKNCKLIFHGVPASNINVELIDVKDRQGFIDMFEIYNTMLKNKLKEANLDFIDAYNETLGDFGVSNKKYHIDEHHLVPEFIKQYLEGKV